MMTFLLMRKINNQDGSMPNKGMEMDWEKLAAFFSFAHRKRDRKRGTFVQGVLDGLAEV